MLTNIFMEEKKPTEEKKKGLLGKIKDATDDKEEQLAILSTFVRLGILIWSGEISSHWHMLIFPQHFRSPNRISIPRLLPPSSQGKVATFGVQTTKKGSVSGGGGAPAASPRNRWKKFLPIKNSQVIHIEHAPLVISTIDPKDDDTTDKTNSVTKDTK